MTLWLALLPALIVAACAPPPAAAPEPVPPSPAGVLDAHIPNFARWPYQAFSREAAVQIALREWRAFGQQVVFPNIELPEDLKEQRWPDFPAAVDWDR